VCNTWSTVTDSFFARLTAPPKVALRLGRRRLRQALGLDPVHRVDIVCPTVHLGSDYGGWTILPDLLDSRSVAYSFGVGQDVSFDLALIDRFGLTVHGFDPTPRSRAWVLAHSLPAAFVFHDYGIADFDGAMTFYPPKREDHVSYSAVPRATRSAASIQGQVLCLATIMRTLGHDHVDLLKMDVEGFEYDVIDALVENRIPVHQLLVEFHHRLPGIGAHKTDHAVRGLRQLGFKLFSLSPSGEEYSFVRE
jgi:FkbM family methyltransferase